MMTNLWGDGTKRAFLGAFFEGPGAGAAMDGDGEAVMARDGEAAMDGAEDGVGIRTLAGADFVLGLCPGGVPQGCPQVMVGQSLP